MLAKKNHTYILFSMLNPLLLSFFKGFLPLIQLVTVLSNFKYTTCIITTTTKPQEGLARAGRNAK